MNNEVIIEYSKEVELQVNLRPETSPKVRAPPLGKDFREVMHEPLM